MNPIYIPAWQEDTLPLLPNAQLENEIERLEMIVIAVEAMKNRIPRGSTALGETMKIVDRGRDLVKSLLTICRAKSSLSVSDSSIGSLRFKIRQLSNRLETGAVCILKEIRKLPDSIKEQLPFSVWLAESNLPFNSKNVEAVSSIVVPLQNMHAHLLSTMKLHVITNGGQTTTMSYAQAVATLKASDELYFRRAVYSSFNAWLAARSNCFADLLNAVLGFRLFRLESENVELDNYCLKYERLSQDAFIAMFDALDQLLPRIRESVTLRAKMLHLDKLPISALLSSAPGENRFYEEQGEFEEYVELIREAMQLASPAFQDFLYEAKDKHWIDLRTQSGRAGNGWCDDLPAHNAIAIFGNYSLNMAGLGNLSHTLGVGFLHRQLHELSALEKRVPLCVIEIAGQFCQTMVDRAMLTRSNGTANSPYALWQIMRRISNMMLLLPMRHRLAHQLMISRKRGIISVPTINKYSENAWDHYFSNIVDGSDQYVWAWKHHFYRPDVFYYDWQYTFGYLLSQHLASSFEKNGKTKANADFSSFCKDAANMNCDDLIKKHLNKDIKNTKFWIEAIEEALKPLAEARALTEQNR